MVILDKIRKLLGIRIYEDEKKALEEANKAKKEKDYETAMEFYKKAGNYYWAGKMAEKLGDDNLAISLYETDKSDWSFKKVLMPADIPQRTDFENISKYPSRIKDAARLYQEHGHSSIAFKLLSTSGYHDDAGKVAEKMGRYDLALKSYKRYLLELENHRPELKPLRQKRIARVKQKINGLEKKTEISRGKGLVQRFLIVLSISVFLGGLFFLSFNITGNSIGNLTNFTSNIISVSLFISGLILVFFWSKKN